MDDGTLNKKYRRRDEIIHRRVAGEGILVPVRGNLADMKRIFALNEVGEFIWHQLDGIRSLREVGEGIEQTFSVGTDEARSDLDTFIADLVREGLIEAVE